MFLASKIGWVGVALGLLTTGILIPGSLRGPARPDSHQEKVAIFITKNEIMKMQETLRAKGHYRGKVDGVFGLRTRASIRAYQKAENLPITGQVDPQTADGLGIRPETTWSNSQSAGREVGHGSDGASGQIKRDKPSAGIKWAEGSGRTSKTPRKAVKAVAAPESGRGDRERKLQAENDNHPR
jgi:peptidoglycan hydrolase-like protein with peptidoglycan-binding domain